MAALEQVKTDTNWQTAANTVNNNFQKVNTDLEKVKNATTRNKGYFATDSELKSKVPSAFAGDIAYVGSKYPYQIWKWNGSTWVNSGQTGGSETVSLGDYYTKAEIEAQQAEQDTLIDNALNEYNVSKFHPTSGINGSNKYTLETAIAQVPSKYRSVGIKCAFFNTSGQSETWEYQGDTWVADSFIQIGGLKFYEFDKSQKQQDEKISELNNKIDDTIEIKEDFANDFSIEDDENNTIVSFKDGRIKTEKFDSHNVEDLEINDIDNNNDFSIEDENGNTIVSFNDGHIKTEKFDSRKIGGSSGLSFDNGYMSLPYDVPRVYINSDLLTVVKGDDGKPTNEIKPLNTSKNEVGDLEIGDVKLTFKSACLNFEDFIVISYQGQSSLTRAKKGFSIDLKEKHRIGKWLEFDSFHLKGYHSDWLHIRDILNAQIYEQMMLKRNIGKNRPYQVYNSLLSSGTYEGLVNSNAMCHIDGFPIELYINDEYWGLYSWNIKKDRSNYCLNKKNASHIMVDAANLTNATLNWAGLEVRAPKGDNLVDINGNEYDGDHPKELMGEDSPLYSQDNEIHVLSAQVKKRIQDFWTKTRQLQSLQDVENLFNVTEFIDCYLLYEFVNDWDIWSRNTLYTTYDGIHFSPLYYDGDGSWGIGMTKQGSGFVDGDVILSPTYDPFVDNAEYNRDLSWVRNIATILNDNIKKRYSELRSCGIFSVENVTILCDRWTKWVGLDVYEKDGERWSYAGFGGSEQGFYDSTKRMKEWISERIIYLDTKYNF